MDIQHDIEYAEWIFQLLCPVIVDNSVKIYSFKYVICVIDSTTVCNFMYFIFLLLGAKSQTPKTVWIHILYLYCCLLFGVVFVRVEVEWSQMLKNMIKMRRWRCGEVKDIWGWKVPIQGLEPWYPAWKASMLTTYIISEPPGCYRTCPSAASAAI